MPGKLITPEEALADGEFYVALRMDPSDFGCDDFDDPHYYVHETEGSIVLSSFGGSTLASIGRFKVIQVDVDGLIAQGISIHDAYDQYQETFDYYEELVDGPAPWGFNDRVTQTLDCEDEIMASGMVIVSELSITPEYRGREFGLRALKILIQRFRMGAGIIAMRPYAPQFHASEEAIDRLGLAQYKGSERACMMKLRAHFGRLGFRLIPGTDVMALATVRHLENVELATW